MLGYVDVLADVAEPFGVVDLDDLDAFIGAFAHADAAADFVPPFDVVDLDDLDAFIAVFLAGCP
ncbi:MAG: GC-type dockerin domain-anchored protein [Planctomycetota bacterium]